MTDVAGVSSFIVDTVTLGEGVVTIRIKSLDQAFTVNADTFVAVYARPDR